MDAQRKTQLEQRIVIGLLGVFAVTLGTSLKNVGVFGARATPAPPDVVAPKAAAPSLRETVASYRERMEPPPMDVEEPSGPEPTEAFSAQRYTAHEARDPFERQLPLEAAPSLATGEAGDAMAAVAAPGAGLSLVVQGILWGGARPTAIINDEVYGIGDAVEGATITRIDRTGVTVEVDGASVHLRLSDVMSASLAPNPVWR